MSGQIVPKRFGLKYSPKPAIALEYQTPDSGLAILEVVIEQLSPGTYDVEGVVDVLQKNHPFHLGPNMVSADQLERLVARLLFEGRAHLPEQYPTPTRMIVEGPQEQPYALSTPLSHESPTKPSLLPKAEGLSGSLSSGPTPAPTPEVQRATRDPSDGSSTASESRRPRGIGFDDAGAERERHSADLDNDEGPHPPTATAASTAAAAFLEDQDVRDWDDDEESSREEGDGERKAREREGKESEQAHDGARDATTEETRGQTKETTSLVDNSSEPDAKHQQHGTLEKKGDEEIYDHGQPDDEAEAYGQHREANNKIEALSTSPKTAAATHATTLNEEPDRENSSGASTVGENDIDKEKLGRGEEQRGEERTEEEFVEIEEEDDDIPEDVESEELVYETSSSRFAESKDNEGQADGGGNEPRSEENGNDKEVGDTDKHVDPSFASTRGTGIAVGKPGAFNRENDRTDNERTGPRVIPGEESSLEPPPPPPVASPPQASPTSASPAAPDATPPSKGVSKEHKSPPLSPRLAPSRDLAPAPSSPEAGAGVGASPLAGLPLAPMGGARQRGGLLGSLPPVGGRGLPSLALPLGTKTASVREEGEAGGAGGGEIEDDPKGTTVATDTLVSSSPSPLLSPRWPATRSPVAEKDPAVVPEPSHLSHATIGAHRKVTGGETAHKDGRDTSSDALDDLAYPSVTRGEEEQGEKEEEAALRARLGFGQEEKEEDEDGDEQEGDGDAGSSDGRENKASSSPGSPKQHQGQEEENAGRIPPPDPRDQEDGGAPAGSGAGGDYFGDSEEASSVGEDMSFEQESVDSDGGGDGTGSDDYFS